MKFVKVKIMFVPLPTLPHVLFLPRFKIILPQVSYNKQKNSYKVYYKKYDLKCSIMIITFSLLTKLKCFNILNVSKGKVYAKTKNGTFQIHFTIFYPSPVTSTKFQRQKRNYFMV